MILKKSSRQSEFMVSAVIRRFAASVLIIALSGFGAGCGNTPARLDRLADAGGLIRYEVVGTDFRHLVYKREGTGSFLYVFIEGDGTPWVGGYEVAADPTPRTAIAFDLMMITTAPAIYVGRPCYFRIQDPACKPSIWTNGRYSERVVQSMTAAIASSISTAETRPIVLVGYSGGGALALLVASNLSNVAAVVTLAGLIDTDAWVAHHGYEALTLSLNPANEILPGNVQQIHIVGGKDQNIPAPQTMHATENRSNTEVWKYDEFDHICCWRERWPELFDKITRSLEK